MDGPPPLVVKTEFPNARFFHRAKPSQRLHSTKEPPLLITLDDDSDVDMKICCDNDACDTKLDQSENFSSAQNISLPSPAPIAFANVPSSDLHGFETGNKNDLENSAAVENNSENSAPPASDIFTRDLYNAEIEIKEDFEETAATQTSVPNSFWSNFYDAEIENQVKSEKEAVIVSAAANLSPGNLTYAEVETQKILEKATYQTSNAGTNARVKVRSKFKVFDVNKNSVSLLNEFCQIRNIKPEYEYLPEIRQNAGEWTTVHRYQIRVGQMEVIGTGDNKKQAKHAAAENLLKELSIVELGEPTKNPVPNDNPIGLLQELCMGRKWPPPRYEEDYGSVQLCGEFKIICNVYRIKKIGLGKTKKMAKRQAAFLMLEALKNLSFSQLEDAQESQEKLEKTNKKENISQNKVNEKDTAEKFDLQGKNLYLCGNESCEFAAETETELKEHLFVCDNARHSKYLTCPHCNMRRERNHVYLRHLRLHGERKFKCGLCDFSSGMKTIVADHMCQKHGMRQIRLMWIESTTKGHSALVPKEKICVIPKTSKAEKKQVAAPTKTTKRERYRCCLSDCDFIGDSYINFMCHLKESHNGITIPERKNRQRTGKGQQTPSVPSGKTKNHVQCWSNNDIKLRRRSNVFSYKDLHCKGESNEKPLPVVNN